MLARTLSQVLWEAVRTLEPVPAVVLAGNGASRPEVDLFPGMRANITDVKVSRCWVKSKRPGLPQAERPDLRLHGRLELPTLRLHLTQWPSAAGFAGGIQQRSWEWVVIP